MKQTDFALHLTHFLKIYLPSRRDLSENTIASYSASFRFFLIFSEEVLKISAEKITLNDFTEENICKYINWLAVERGNSAATQKQRLAAIHVFVRYLKTRSPEYLLEYQKILDIKVATIKQNSIGHFTPDEVKAILSGPDTSTFFGRRDMVLLALLYDSAARVQEICDLKVGDLRLKKPYAVSLTGKGRKTRVVPLMNETTEVLKTYLTLCNLNAKDKVDSPLFYNHQNHKLTRAGVTYILKKYCDMARQKDSGFPSIVSPHMLRHSKAMHMLQAGINLIYIRDFLGHSQVATTEMYARADTEMKRIAIQATSPKLISDIPDWREDESLMTMLTDLCK